MPPFHFLVVFTRLACCRSVCGRYLCHCWTALFVDWIKIYHSERQKNSSVVVHVVIGSIVAAQPGLSAFPFVGNSMCRLPLNCVTVSYCDTSHACRSLFLNMCVISSSNSIFCRIGFSSRFKYPLNLNWTPLNLNLWFGPKFSEVAELNLKFSSRFTSDKKPWRTGLNWTAAALVPQGILSSYAYS